MHSQPMLRKAARVTMMEDICNIGSYNVVWSGRARRVIIKNEYASFCSLASTASREELLLAKKTNVSSAWAGESLPDSAMGWDYAFGLEVVAGYCILRNRILRSCWITRSSPTSKSAANSVFYTNELFLSSLPLPANGSPWLTKVIQTDLHTFS